MPQHRKFDVAMFGFTEEEWRVLPEERRNHFLRRAYYIRNQEKRRAYAREYSAKNRDRLNAEKREARKQGTA